MPKYAKKNAPKKSNKDLKRYKIIIISKIIQNYQKYSKIIHIIYVQRLSFGHLDSDSTQTVQVQLRNCFFMIFFSDGWLRWSTPWTGG
jgi:hypothetical protein